MDEGTSKTPILKCRLYWSFLHFCLGWWSNFVGSYGQKESVKLLQNIVYNTIHLRPPTTNPQPHTVCVYCTFSLGKGWGGRGQREGRGATVHKYIYSSMGQQFTSWVENTNHEWMYLQSIQSVKHNAAKSVNRSILKKSRHTGFGIFIVHSSMCHSTLNNLTSCFRVSSAKNLFISSWS